MQELRATSTGHSPTYCISEGLTSCCRSVNIDARALKLQHIALALNLKRVNIGAISKRVATASI